MPRNDSFTTFRSVPTESGNASTDINHNDTVQRSLGHGIVFFIQALDACVASDKLSSLNDALLEAVKVELSELYDGYVAPTGIRTLASRGPDDDALIASIPERIDALKEIIDQEVITRAQRPRP